MKKRKLPTGIENFEEIVEDYYYVDKTSLIEQVVEQGSKVTLFTRPRRFGKSLNMSMLKCFFEIGTNPLLFDNLYISKNSELCGKYLGRYPVIFISLKGIDADSYTKACAQLIRIINREARRFQILLKSDNLSEVDKKLFLELLDREDEVKEWYDGYRFGKTDVYCPWDVVNYCNDHLNNPDAEPENYWINTSGNNIINRFVNSFKEPDMLTKTELEWLVNGKIVRKRVDEMITYKELYSSIDNLWSTLFMTGYLTQRGKESDGRYCLVVPNREIRNIITECILTIFREEVKNDSLMAEQFCESLREGKADEVEQLLTAYMQKTISIRDTFVRKAFKENFYHGILLGILSYKGDWNVSSNREFGDGFSDVLIEVGDSNIGIVIEVKYTDENGSLEKDCKEALKQIDEKRYTQMLEKEGIEQILKYGIAFQTKKCCVRRGELS